MPRWLLANAPALVEALKVIFVKPSPTTELHFGCAIKRVEAYPQAIRVGAFHQGSQALHFLGHPLTRMHLTIDLHPLPGIIPPAAILVCLLRGKQVSWGFRIFTFSVNRTKIYDTIAHRKLILKRRLLRIGFPAQHEDRLSVQRPNVFDVRAFRDRCKPWLIFPKEREHRGEMLGLIIFKVEIEGNQWPIAMVALAPLWVERARKNSSP